MFSGDNNVDGTLPDEDEDDHDPAFIEVIQQQYDLALTKVLSSTGPFYPGDDVTFDITVINQMTGDATVQNIEIVDYIPTGLTLNDTAWTDNTDGTASYTYTGTLDAAGGANDSVTVPVTFTIDTGVLGDLVNWAEIKSFQNEDGDTVLDVDSTPDMTDGNDAFTGDYAVGGEIPDGSTDNTTDGDGTDDEDDHDPALVTVSPAYDLALVKTLNTPAT